MSQEWVRGPFGLDARTGRTRRVRRTVLVVVHQLVAGTRLADVVPLLECDRRVQVVFTREPSSRFANGAARYLERLGGVILPWEQAMQQEFDLVLAAHDRAVDRLHGPVLLFPHGVGMSKRDDRRYWRDPRAAAAGIVLAHHRQRAQLTRACPDAARVAFVGGDPTFDRLAASTDARAEYRRALDAEDRRLVVVSSTWGPGSLLGRHRELLPNLVTALPRDRYTVVAVLHPNIWCWHSPRQIHAWYADCLRSGLRLLPPEEGWRAALVASDLVIGDHGSVTYYAAALGRPVLLAAFPAGEVVPGSQVALLGRAAPRLQVRRSLRRQVDAAIAGHSAARYARVRTLVSSVPGQAAGLIRRAMYELMRLPEPDGAAQTSAVPLPSTEAA